MPLHLLGISRRADVCREGDIHWVVEGELAAAAMPPPPPSTGPLTHAALLAALYRHGDILPVRFGVVLPHEEAVRELLVRRREVLLHDLDRLRGAGEIGLRIELPRAAMPPLPPAPAAACHTGSSPAQYLAARRARYQLQDQLSRCAQFATETCVLAMKGLYRSWQRLSPEPPGIVRLAFLVERTLSAAFAARLNGFRAQQRAEQRTTLLGPWPPYSFVCPPGA